MAALMTSRTVGVIPVHLFGLCADIDPITDFVKRHGLWMIEDAACALGGRYHDRSAGTFGDFGCFSFHPRKSITTGEGGMITTSKDALDQLARSLRDHGASPIPSGGTSVPFLLPEFNRVGFNYRMTDIQGAIGCAQMDRLNWILERRSQCANFYDELLSDVDWLALPYTPTGSVHGYQAYVCLFRPAVPDVNNVLGLHKRRNDLMSALQEKGIATRQGTHAPVMQGYYAQKYGLRPEQFPQAYIADRLSLALPLYPQLTESEQTYVAETLRAQL
jgi:perosamine synthetase